LFDAMNDTVFSYGSTTCAVCGTAPIGSGSLCAAELRVERGLTQDTRAERLDLGAVRASSRGRPPERHGRDTRHVRDRICGFRSGRSPTGRKARHLNQQQPGVKITPWPCATARSSPAHGTGACARRR
jgi:hypothetical protein